ncbi:TPA: hypothetical protein N0F65_010605 [Lagenidium giganteum]
MNLPT